MRPHFKLLVLLLAKMQWDARHCPGLVAARRTKEPWPAKALTRAVPKLRSPCVAGDLLLQRAPGLVRSVHSSRRLVEAGRDMQWTVVEESLCALTPIHLGAFLGIIRTYLLIGWPTSQLSSVIDAQELGLLLEVSELYCLVAPSNQSAPLLRDVWRCFTAGLTCSEDLAVQLTGSPAEALLSIAEYLTEDLLLVQEGSAADAAAAGSPASASSRTAAAHQRILDSSSKKDSNAAALQQTAVGSAVTGTAAERAKDSSSSRIKRPTAGARNPSVSMEHRLAWAHDATDVLNILEEQHQAAMGMLQGQAGGRMGATWSIITPSSAPRLFRLLETHLRTPAFGSLMGHTPFLLPRALPALHAAASTPAGSRALLSAITTVAKRQQVMHAALAALVKAGGHLLPAAAGVIAAVPGAMGQMMAELVLKEPAMVVERGMLLGMDLVSMAEALMTRAAALLDPLLAPGAAYLARVLPSGQDNKLWGLEALLTNPGQAPRLHGMAWHGMEYNLLLQTEGHVEYIREALEGALAHHHAKPAARQAAKLARQAGAGPAEAEQLRQQLQSMWLGREATGCAELSALSAAVPQGACAAAMASPAAGTTATCQLAPGELPFILQTLCTAGFLRKQDVLAAGDPAQWAAAMREITAADLQMAATALLVACKAAGPVAQLPQLLEQVQGVMKQQPWGERMFAWMGGVGMPDLASVHNRCSKVVDWALLLAPLLRLLLPAQQAAQLLEAADGVSRDGLGTLLLTPEVTTHVLGLLGHVVVPGAPGCSYPGCCNLEGRTETELPLQACSKCRGVRYCCREHQVAHWKAGHKEVCLAAQAAAKQIV